MKDFAVLKKVTSQAEADILCGLLKFHGFYSFSTADDCGGVEPFLNASIGVKVWVRKEDFDDAFTLIGGAS